MHKMGSPLSLYLENTRQDQENNNVHKWHRRQWELTQSWQEIRQMKRKTKVKMINNFYHINDYPLSRDKKYLGIIPDGRLQRYPTSSSHQTHKQICNL